MNIVKEIMHTDSSLDALKGIEAYESMLHYEIQRAGAGSPACKNITGLLIASIHAKAEFLNRLPYK